MIQLPQSYTKHLKKHLNCVHFLILSIFIIKTVNVEKLWFPIILEWIQKQYQQHLSGY